MKDINFRICGNFTNINYTLLGRVIQRLSVGDFPSGYSDTMGFEDEGVDDTFGIKCICEANFVIYCLKG